MLWPFKRAPRKSVDENTFAAGVRRFWEWYAGVAARFYSAIDEKRASDLAGEMRGKVQDSLGDFAWVFGPGAEGRGHSLTLSGEGDIHKQLLAAYWQARAPALPGWTFYASRQPSTTPGLNHFKIGDLDFDPGAFWLTPRVSLERQIIDLVVWHPLFPQLEDGARWMVLYLFLDEALGEIGTGNWIGQIEMNDRHLAEAIPLAELLSFAERVSAEQGWKKGSPGETWTLYKMPGDDPARPRGDIYVGTTCHIPLMEQSAGEMKNPLEDLGADYVYVQVDVGFLPQGGEATARGEIEDALIAALEPMSGRLLGGAMGRRFAYIDLLLFDGERSQQLVLETLRRKRLPKGTSLNFFAHEKRGHRVLI